MQTDRNNTNDKKFANLAQKIMVENTINIYQMKANFMAEIMAQFL